MSVARQPKNWQVIVPSRENVQAGAFAPGAPIRESSYTAEGLKSPDNPNAMSLRLEDAGAVPGAIVEVLANREVILKLG